MGELIRERRPRNAEEREAHRQYQAEAYNRLREDPEAHAEHLERRRGIDRARRGVPPERWKGPRNSKALPPVLVPAAPFAAWLRDSGHTITELEAVMNPRARLAIAKGEQANVELDTVDRVLLHVDDGTTLDDLYPRGASMTDREAA